MPYNIPTQKTKNHCISHFTFHSSTYVAVGHRVCFAICEMECEIGCELWSHPYCYWLFRQMRR